MDVVLFLKEYPHLFGKNRKNHANTRTGENTAVQERNILHTAFPKVLEIHNCHTSMHRQRLPQVG